ncbi:hypothetical protein NA8A_03840 [Nitratireductor indicus C115]|uniref:Zinc-finger protein n=1 Tax=Nitratireductor indicus C115 TaxID=1231190 RepID=K2NXA5_9HYPH|nr:DUF983 domain-containing protein [Nitratireductor indicus]EKF43910.1 hypothetical protein NA8A_03840 [Nitratireductor indicus C115]SFQ14403.1 Uncharacterized conserved protein, DUF983 family [Nitratireductor indicus]
MAEEQLFGGANVKKKPARSAYEAMKRGFFGRCPHCGEGKLFRSYLKVEDRCAVCGEELHHHRADDLPAYLVIFIVGHIVVGAFMGMEAVTDWPGWVHLSIWVPITLIMSLALIGPIKGSIVGLQWAYYMHGFGGETDSFETHPEQL